MSRKHPSIDLIKLLAGRESNFLNTSVNSNIPADEYAVHNTLTNRVSIAHGKWNEWLTKCLKTKDLSDLIRVRYGIMVGMDDCAKAGLNTEVICEMYCRWMGSIDKTARKIIKKKIPIPRLNKEFDLDGFNRTHVAKRNRDSEFELFLKRSSF